MFKRRSAPPLPRPLKQESRRRLARLGPAGGRLVAAAVLAATAVLVVPATPASAAAPGLVSVSASTGSDSNVYKSVRVHCPAGTQVIGGAFDLQGAEGAVVLDDFIPSATDLLVGAGEIVGPGEPADGTKASWQITATVTCANPLPGYSIVSRTSDFTRTNDKRVVVACPPGRRGIGGGASLRNGWGQVSIAELGINGFGFDGTTASAVIDADGYDGLWSVTTYAICADPLPGRTQVAEETFTFTGLSLTAEAFCSRPSPAIGAAWRVDKPDNMDRYVARAAISGGPDPRVTVSAFAADQVSGRWAVEATAVCVDG